MELHRLGVLVVLRRAPFVAPVLGRRKDRGQLVSRAYRNALIAVHDGVIIFPGIPGLRGARSPE